MGLYRVVQEALRNIAKHADARHVHITLRRVEEEVQLAVADDGKGFTLARAHEVGTGLGLRSIEERVRLLGGRLSIDTAPGRVPPSRCGSRVWYRARTGSPRSNSV